MALVFYDDDEEEERSMGEEGAPEGMGEESRAGAATLLPPMAASLWSGGRMALCFTNDR